MAAKAAFEAAKEAANAFDPVWRAARDEYLAAVREARKWRDCGCNPKAYRIMDEKYAYYLKVKAVGDVLVEAYNRAQEEWDRVRDVSKVNLP